VISLKWETKSDAIPQNDSDFVNLVILNLFHSAIKFRSAALNLQLFPFQWFLLVTYASFLRSYFFINLQPELFNEYASVKSLTSDRRWSDHVFISGDNLHLTCRFYGVVLGITTIFKMISEPLQDSMRNQIFSWLVKQVSILAYLIRKHMESIILSDQVIIHILNYFRLYNLKHDFFLIWTNQNTWFFVIQIAQILSVFHNAQKLI